MLETGQLAPVGEQDPSFRAVLSNRSFLSLWLGQVFSQLADKVILVYLIVLLVMAGFSSNSDVSRLTLVFTIPAVVFGSIAGVFVDRWNKKWLMIISNVLRGACVMALPMALWFKEPSSVWIYGLTFGISTVTQFFAPAEIAMIPTIVEKRNLLAANSLFTTTMLGSVVIGFGLGEAILSRVGDKNGHWAIGGMYFLSALFLLLVKPRIQAARETAEATAGALFREFKEGFDYVLKDRRIIFLLLRLIILFSAFAALTILAVGFVEDVLKLDKRYFSYILSAAGLGMGISAGVVGRFGSRMGKERLISGGFIAMGALLMSLANIQLINGWLHLDAQWERVLAFVFAFLLGLPAAAIAVPIQTLLQEEIPEHLRGKVFGVQNMLVNTAMTLPMSLAGVLADILDQRFQGYGVVLVMNLVGLVLVCGAFLRLPALKPIKKS